MKKHTISKILDYFFAGQEFKDEAIEAMKDFFDRPDLGSGANLEILREGKDLFNEWLVYDFRLKNGNSLLTEYRRRNPDKMKPADMEVYKNLEKAVYSVFEILDVRPGRGLTLKDLLGGREYEIKERMGSYQLKPGYIIFTRVAFIDGNFKMVSADGPVFPFDGQAKENLLNLLKAEEKLTPKFYYHFLKIMNDVKNTLANNSQPKDGQIENEEFFPRNEFEMCSLFENLVFMQRDYGQGLLEIRPDEMSKQKLWESGLINLIFRRWLQTTWGINNWTDHFEGETPRQELARMYPELNKGGMHFTVGMEKEDGRWRVRPAVFSQKVNRRDDFYDFALEESKKNDEEMFYPVYDKFFRRFSSWLDETIEINKKAGIKKRPVDKFEERFGAFWNNAAANVLFNLDLDIEKSRLIAITGVVQEILNRFFHDYKEEPGYFLDMDSIFEKIWIVLANADSRLMSMAEIHNQGMLDKKNNYSNTVYFHLGLNIDKHILLPMERYFNGLELIWTVKDNFLADLHDTLALLKKIKNLSNKDRFRSQKEADIMEEMEDIWYSPCTSFRPIGKVYDFFREMEI
jgi:hypothetical protein